MRKQFVMMKTKAKVKAGEPVYFRDVAMLIEEDGTIDFVVTAPIDKSQQYVVVEALEVITPLRSSFPEAEIEMLGPSYTLVEVEHKKKTPSLLTLGVVWMILFVGSGLAIMNFHEDVSMREVQERLVFFITGNPELSPLYLQIPYSIGLAVGMVVFFNHLFKKKINEEPSPLEIEMFNYREDIDRYLTKKELAVKEKQR